MNANVYNSNIYSLIKKEYEQKQALAYRKLMEKKRELFFRIPELQDIEDKIQKIGFTYSKLILSGKKSSDTEVSALLFDMEKLRSKKKELLKANNYSEEDLEPEYECKICKDTGFVDDNGVAVKCSCYRQKVINYLYNQSNLSRIEQENFDTFNENYYPDVVDEKRYGIKISPRENILRIKERCMAFIENFDSPNEKNLFFSGPTGVGKTFMASCIARELINRGKTVLYQTAPVLFNTINEFKFRQSSVNEELNDAAYRNIFEVELLIIDDLGIEPATSARYAELLTILNTRQDNNYNHPCKTIISTNIGPKQLYEFYTERVASRIVGYFDRLMFAGEDIRMLKK